MGRTKQKSLTQSSVDALYAKGLSIKQIAGLYGCSKSRIATLKSRKPQGWRADGEYRNPIREGELSEARQVPIGTPVRVMNPWKKNSREDFSWGIWEHARVAHKYPHIAVLDNGMSVDYAEIAMQMRERSGKLCM